MLYSRKAYLLKKFQQASKKIENAYNPTEQSHQQIRSLHISQDKIWTRQTSKNELPMVVGKSANSFYSAYRDQKRKHQ